MQNDAPAYSIAKVDPTMLLLALRSLAHMEFEVNPFVIQKTRQTLTLIQEQKLPHLKDQQPTPYALRIEPNCIRFLASNGYELLEITLPSFETTDIWAHNYPKTNCSANHTESFSQPITIGFYSIMPLLTLATAYLSDDYQQDYARQQYQPTNRVCWLEIDQYKQSILRLSVHSSIYRRAELELNGADSWYKSTVELDQIVSPNNLNRIYLTTDQLLAYDCDLLAINAKNGVITPAIGAYIHQALKPFGRYKLEQILHIAGVSREPIEQDIRSIQLSQHIPDNMVCIDYSQQVQNHEGNSYFVNFRGFISPIVNAAGC